ncbi:hypothetical protein BDV12DRAFT_168438 [Aspergillus spectabilis]
MSSQRGGSFSEMAEKGTKIPNDAGLMNTIPSVPRPDQRSDHPDYEYGGIGQPSTASAADNYTDLPRSTRDVGFTGEVMTGTGNTFPAQGENAGNEIGSNTPGAKGQTRRHQHGNKNRGMFDTLAGEDEDSGEFIGEHEVRNLE